MTNEQERGLTVPSQGNPQASRPEAKSSPFPVPLTRGFIETKEYDRFAQSCRVCQRYGAIAVSIGNSGVGQTKAARNYTHWDLLEPFLAARGMDIQPYFSPDCPPPRTAYYWPRSTVTPKGLERELTLLLWSVQMLADNAQGREVSSHVRPGGIDLLVVDEVDRLLTGCLEVLRDFYARYHLGLMLLVRPGGLSRLLSLEPLASGVGIFHLFQALSQDATRQVLEQQAQQWGVKVEEKGAKVFVDRTQGNFTTMSHFLMHLSYLVEHRGILTLTKEAVDIAASMVMSRQSLQQMREYFRETEPL